MAKRNEGEDPTEAELRERLRAIEAEHADLLTGTMGLIGIGNAELWEKIKERGREADELRVRLGEPPRNPPETSRRLSAVGWSILLAVIAGLAGLALLLRP